MPRSGIAAETIRLVFTRARDRCEYCQSPQDHCPDPFSIEHIHPQALGGTHQADNLALSCPFTAIAARKVLNQAFLRDAEFARGPLGGFSL